MPHAVFDHKIEIALFQQGFEKVFEKKEGIIKIEDIYLNRLKNQALLPAIVVEEKSQNFLIEIQVKEDKTTVRLYPGTDPEKTVGVKRALGIVATKIKEKNPNTNIIKTNIKEFIG